MAIGKSTKKIKKQTKDKRDQRARPSKGQSNADAGKLVSLDRTIDEHQKAQFFGKPEGQLSFERMAPTCRPRKASHLKGLENLANVSTPRRASQMPRRHGPDLGNLDGVLSTLSKIDFNSAERKQSPPAPKDTEIDV